MNEARARVLIVEDDARLADLVGEYLTDNGFDVRVEMRGDRAVDRILAEPPDLVVLDVMLPGLDGLEVGADDYLAKPVRPRLLLAHLTALLRRVRELGPPSPTTAGGADVHAPGHAADAAPDPPLTVGPLAVDPRARAATLAGRPVDLTDGEFDLLLLLARHAGEVLTREAIYQELRGIEYDGVDRSIDLRVARLRRKLDDDARQPRLLKSVRGVGYLLAWPRR